jgi:hypothetical protein
VGLAGEHHNRNVQHRARSEVVLEDRDVDPDDEDHHHDRVQRDACL